MLVNSLPVSAGLPSRQIDRRRRRPVIAEQLLDRPDRGVGALDQRMAVLRVRDRGRQHVGERHGAVVAQQQHPGVEHAGHAGREQAGAGHHVEAFALVMRDGRAGGRRALAADLRGTVVRDGLLVRDPNPPKYSP